MILVFAPNPALERVALVEQNAPAVTTVTAPLGVIATPAVRAAREKRPGRPMRVTTYAGGAGLRAANVIRLLGGDVLATGFAGGNLGGLLRECLERQEIPHDFTPVAAGTRGDFLVLDREKGIVSDSPDGTPVFTEAEAETLLGIFGRHLAGASLAILSSGPANSDDEAGAAMAALFIRALAMARAAGVPVLADVSGADFSPAVDGGVWLLRINYRDLQRQTERSLRHDSAIIEEARGLVARGVENVVVTIGEEGALLVNAGGAWRVKAPVVSHYNPTACGETLSGALAVQYGRNGGDLLDALRYGCAAASVNVTHDEPGYATPGEVGVLYPRTQAGPVLIR